MQRRVPAGPDEGPARTAERVSQFATIKDHLTADALGTS